MTYQIVVRERGADRDVVLCEVSTNPHPIAEGARQKVLHVDIDGTGRLVEVAKYERVNILHKR